MMKNNKKLGHKSYLYCKVTKTHKEINVADYILRQQDHKL